MSVSKSEELQPWDWEPPKTLYPKCGPLYPGEPDPIAKPAHYVFSEVEPIAAIDAWGLGFCLGNVVKYVARAGRKGDALEDLRKAQWYLAREIGRREREPDAPAPKAPCTCGSGGHPRRCETHPWGFTMHALSMDHDNLHEEVEELEDRLTQLEGKLP